MHVRMDARNWALRIRNFGSTLFAVVPRAWSCKDITSLLLSCLVCLSEHQGAIICMPALSKSRTRTRALFLALSRSHALSPLFRSFALARALSLLPSSLPLSELPGFGRRDALPLKQYGMPRLSTKSWPICSRHCLLPLRFPSLLHGSLLPPITTEARLTLVYMCLRMCMHACMYLPLPLSLLCQHLYIYRNRERKRERERNT
jgi:hypothetical protein